MQFELFLDSSREGSAGGTTKQLNTASCATDATQGGSCASVRIAVREGASLPNCVSKWNALDYGHNLRGASGLVGSSSSFDDIFRLRLEYSSNL